MAERGEEELLESLRSAAATLGSGLAEAGAVPLLDCHICVTGFEQDDRDCVAELAAALGGAYSSELARGTCTHLVTTDGSTTSAKCRHALRWGDVEVVSLRWLVACVEQKVRVSEEAYRIAPPEPPPPVAPPPPAVPLLPRVNLNEPVWDQILLSGCRFFIDEQSCEPHTCAISPCVSGSADFPASVDRIRSIAWVGGAVVVGERGAATHVVSLNPALPGERVVLMKPADVLKCTAG